MIELMYFSINENSLSENLTIFASLLCPDKKTPAGAGVFSNRQVQLHTEPVTVGVAALPEPPLVPWKPNSTVCPG